LKFPPRLPHVENETELVSDLLHSSTLPLFTRLSRASNPASFSCSGAVVAVLLCASTSRSSRTLSRSEPARPGLQPGPPRAPHLPYTTLQLVSSESTPPPRTRTSRALILTAAREGKTSACARRHPSRP
jgi:hypothetical protein